MTALVLLEYDDAGIKQPSRSAVTAALKLGDVPLFAYTTTPPGQNVVFTPGAVTTAGQAKFTACDLSSSSATFSGSIHLVAFRG